MALKEMLLAPEGARYGQIAKARAMAPEALIAELQAANLRGRGGAGFPMGRKASLIDRGSAKPSTSWSTPTSRSPARSRTAR